MIYFTSDNHFNHRSIVDRQPRPFRDVDHMNMTMIDLWNDTVQPNDTVYCLGDFAYDNGVMDLEDLFGALNGIKHLVAGNHDYQYSTVLDLPWASVSDLRSVNLAGRWATLCHYPLEVWQGNSRGSLMLHGHSHGTLKRPLANRIDVGVDCWDYTPVSADDLLRSDEVVFRSFEAQDMHGEYDYTKFED